MSDKTRAVTLRRKVIRQRSFRIMWTDRVLWNETRVLNHQIKHGYGTHRKSSDNPLEDSNQRVLLALQAAR